MSVKTILITGGSGFIGHEVLRQTLAKGHHIRAIFRSQSNIEKTKQALADPKLISMIDFVIIPNLAEPGVFHKHMSDVSHIISIATPIPSNDPNDDVVRAAVDITTNVLTAARDTPTVRRVIITSSIGAYVPIADYLSGKLQEKPFNADDDNCHYDITTKWPHPLLAYAASKALALDYAQTFIDEQKPKFDVIFFMPSMVIGGSKLDTSTSDVVKPSGTNATVMGLLLGQESSDALLGSSVSLYDTAQLQVLALDTSIPAGRYMVASGGAAGTNFLDAFGIVKKHFPGASEKVFAKSGERTVLKMNVDISKTERAFGMKFQGFEEQVKSVVSSYLTLLEKNGE